VQLIPTAVNPGFLDRSRYFSFKQLLDHPYKALWTLIQANYFSEKLVAPGIETEASKSQLEILFHTMLCTDAVV
jgi:hypothetical protein